MGLSSGGSQNLDYLIKNSFLHKYQRQISREACEQLVVDYKNKEHAKPTCQPT